MSHNKDSADKARRRAIYQKQIECLCIDCSACSGSGRYDHNGSPKCGACEGTGKDTVTLDRAIEGVSYDLDRKARYEKVIAESKYGDRWAERELKKTNRFLRKLKAKIEQYRPGLVIKGL